MGYTVVVRNFLGEPSVVRSTDGSTTQATVVDVSFRPETLYAVSVAARNMEGVGLNDTVEVTTAPAPNGNELLLINYDHIFCSFSANWFTR